MSTELIANCNTFGCVLARSSSKTLFRFAASKKKGSRWVILYTHSCSANHLSQLSFNASCQASKIALETYKANKTYLAVVNSEKSQSMVGHTIFYIIIHIIGFVFPSMLYIYPFDACFNISMIKCILDIYRGNSAASRSCPSVHKDSFWTVK